jgi:hypothetical protein
MLLDSSKRPVGGGRCGALVLPMGGGASLVDCSGSRSKVRWSAGKTSALSGSALTADASRVAISSLRLVRVDDTGHRKASFVERIDGFAGMSFARDRTLVVFDTAGQIVRVPPSGVTRRTRLALDGNTVRAAGVDETGTRALVVTTAGEVLLVDLAHDRVIARPTPRIGLATAITARFSRDGRDVVVLARRGFAVIDAGTGQTVRSGELPSFAARDAEYRDAVIAPDRRHVLIVRADEGVLVVPLEAWRRQDGRALLTRTAGLVPRAAARGEIDALEAGPP